MALSINRLAAAAIALLITLAIVVAIVRGVGNRQPAVASASAAAADSYCERFLSDTQVSASAPPHQGRYANPTYGYAFIIPAGLAGYAPVHAPARDLVMPLAGKPRAVLRVDAAYDALYDITAAGVHRRDSVDVRLFDRLISDESQPFSLAGVQGGRYRMQILCLGDANPYVFESIIVIRNREIYRLDLQSRPDRLRQDEAMLDTLAGGWSWIAPP